MPLKINRTNWSGCARLGLHQSIAVALSLALLLAPAAWADRTALKPGWNMFSPDQDVQVGQQVAQDAERQLPMMNDARVDNYLNTLGQRLAMHAPGHKFPYNFKGVNDKAINAFALPGGHVYINRGTIEAADNEAQLAGVMAHEASHVALRHGTNQASKSYAAQMPLAILGGVLGSNSIGGVLAQLGAGFTLNSILLKYSRNDESQADIMGTQILYDSGYDPRGMSQFLEKLQSKDTKGHRVDFFSDHPSPDRRVERVNDEIAKLGGPPRGARSDSREFDDIRRYVQSLPQAPTRRQGRQMQQGGGNGGGRGGSSPNSQSDYPSENYKTLSNALVKIDYPDNWQAYGQGDAATIAPREGIVDDGRGNQAVAVGVVISVYQPHNDAYGSQLQGPGYGEERSQNQGYGQQGQPQSGALEQDTDQLISELRQSNRNMRIVRHHQRVRVDGQPALSTFLSNDSPIDRSGREINWLVTMERPEGLLFFVFTAPEREFRNYEPVYQQMLDSVRLNR